VVERVDEHRPRPPGVLGGRCDRRLKHRPLEVHLGAVGPGRGQLGQRRAGEHEHRGPDPQQMCGERHPLGVVARAGGDDAPRTLPRGQAVQPGVGPPDLE